EIVCPTRKENPAREFETARSNAPLPSADHSMKEVDGALSGPKKNRPPPASPHPRGVPIVVVSMFEMSVGIARKRSYSVPPVDPWLESVNEYNHCSPLGATV